VLVRFAPQATANDITNFLGAYKAKVVDGPLNMGNRLYVIRLSETNLALGLKNDAMLWRISRSNSIIRWKGYRVSASRLAESNFRYAQASDSGRIRLGLLFSV
jgi:hypothetical protein